MPRYVILEHDHPYRHWDLMLECGPVLKTWRLAAPPAPGTVVRAEPTFDHRLLYLDYEGPISAGRGNVVRWDHGTFAGEWTEARVTAELQGQRLVGRLRLEAREEGVWEATFTEEGEGK
jgi:hypothetical protein